MFQDNNVNVSLKRLKKYEFASIQKPGSDQQQFRLQSASLSLS